MDKNSKPPGTFRIASYNVHKSVGRDRRRNPLRILRVIKSLNADIVALQEVDFRLNRRPTTIPHDLVIEKTGMDYVPLSINEQSIGWHGNAVFVRQGTTVTGYERLPLPALEPRGAVLVEYEINGRRLRLVGTHLGLVRRNRLRQLSSIVELLAERPKMPTLIAGDFNEWSPVKGMTPLEDQFDICAPGPSFHSAQPVAALDRIAYTNALELRSSGVCMTNLARRASDHLPVWADFQII